MPTKERADLAEVYDVSGDETAILYNYERQEQTGIYEMDRRICRSPG